jgi:hypothetical protein
MIFHRKNDNSELVYEMAKMLASVQGRLAAHQLMLTLIVARMSKSDREFLVSNMWEEFEGGAGGFALRLPQLTEWQHEARSNAFIDALRKGLCGIIGIKDYRDPPSPQSN